MLLYVLESVEIVHLRGYSFCLENLCLLLEQVDGLVKKGRGEATFINSAQ